jgi:hypothetical protein
MSEQYKVAIFRALLSAALVGAATVLTAYEQSSNFQTALIAGIAAAVGILAARAGIEGTVDHLRANPPAGSA